MTKGRVRFRITPELLIDLLRMPRDTEFEYATLVHGSFTTIEFCVTHPDLPPASRGAEPLVQPIQHTIEWDWNLESAE